MHSRVLILGTTGLGKRSVADNLRDHLKNTYQHEYRVVDFEKDYFKHSRLFKNWSNFMSEQLSTQHQIWNDGWKAFSESLGGKTFSDQPTILLLHSVYVRENFGIRSTVDINDICRDFQPTLVITLIDDIYKVWWETETRAEGESFRGRPSFEQLLLARRAEVLFGDLISNQRILDLPARHIVCSVNHPIYVLLNLVFHNSSVVYLSFPISAARDLLKIGDSSLEDAINNLHSLAVDRMRIYPDQVYISPLAIDELPFREAGMEALESSKSEIEFDMSSRWSLQKLWNNCDLINTIVPTPKPVPVDQLEYTHGLIQTDVGWRDYKLVSQSDALAIYCPIAPNRKDVSRGVKGEWQKATEEGIPCYIFQNKKWDKKNALKKQLDAGSMQNNPVTSTTHQVSTVEELFNRCKNL